MVRIPKVRPPEKKKYEEEMEALTNTIKGKETQLVSFGDNCGLVSGTACIENRYSCKKIALNILHLMRIFKLVLLSSCRRIYADGNCVAFPFPYY